MIIRDFGLGQVSLAGTEWGTMAAKNPEAGFWNMVQQKLTMQGISVYGKC